MNKYTELTKQDKLALTDDQFYKAVKLEAIDRGIAPPVTIEEALRKTEFRGFEIPGEAICLYEIVAPKNYSGKPSGICFLTDEDAKKALDGMISIEEDGYGATARAVIREGEFCVQQRWISLKTTKSHRSNIEEFFQDNAEFDKVAEECRKDWMVVLQEAYDIKINQQKRAEFLRLADGDEEVAKRFWSKVEKTEWPAALPEAV